MEDRIGKLSDILRGGGTNTNPAVVLAFSIVDTIGERNSIELYIKLQQSCAINDKQIQFSNLPLGNIGAPLGSPIYPSGGGNGLGKNLSPPVEDGGKTTYDPTVTPVPNPWGYNTQAGSQAFRSSGIEYLALRCYLQTPCNDNHTVTQTGVSPDMLPTANQDSTEQPTAFPAGNDTTQIYQNPSVPDLSKYTAPNLADTGNGNGNSTQSSLYTTAAGETRLDINPLSIALPIADDPANYQAGNDTCVFLPIGLPQARLTLHFDCEQVGSWPNVPQPLANFEWSGTGVTKTINGKLLSCSLHPMPPTLDATATQTIYRCNAQITYALNRPPQPSESIPVGVLPFTNLTPDKTVCQLQQLYQGANAQIFGDQSGNANQSKTGYS